MTTFSAKAISFFKTLNVPSELPCEVKVLNPYENSNVKTALENFDTKFYNDYQKRIYILGINPGRFGGGLTGISFTDPVALKKYCGIDNQFGNKEELSSNFIYLLISQFGGVRKFFSKFFLSAIYPLALIKNEKNYNYYDDKKLLLFLKPHLADSLLKQFDFGADSKNVICLGKKTLYILMN